MSETADRRALDEFASLIDSNARESSFQKLFARNPHILSSALPLKVAPSDIRPLGRPGRSEPDFIIFPSSPDVTGNYGIVEIKRPSSRIITSPRKGLIHLTRDADTAFSQAHLYRDLGFPHVTDRALILGNEVFCFIIMGMSSELASIVQDDLSRRLLAGKIPNGCQLIPYDVIYERFASAVQPRFIQLIPSVLSSTGRSLNAYSHHLYQLQYFELSEDAFCFWSDLEDALRSQCGLELSTRGKILERSRWEVQVSGQLDTEWIPLVDYQGCISTLIAAMADLNDESAADLLLSARRFRRGIGHVDAFLRGSLPANHMEIMHRALADRSEEMSRHNGCDLVTIDLSVADKRRFVEESGCFDFVSTDSGDSWLRIHPYAIDDFHRHSLRY